MKLIAIVFGVCMLCLADSAQEALHRAETFIDRERFAEALAGYERALAAQQRAASSNPITEAVLGGNIAEALVALGRPDEALQRLAEAEAHLAEAGDVLPRQKAQPLRIRGLALLAKGQARAAVPPLEQALELLSAASGQPAQPVSHAETEWALARALRATDRRHEERARTLARHAREVLGKRGRAGERAVQAIDAWLAAAP